MILLYAISRLIAKVVSFVFSSLFYKVGWIQSYYYAVNSKPDLHTMFWGASNLILWKLVAEPHVIAVNSSVNDREQLKIFFDVLILVTSISAFSIVRRVVFDLCLKHFYNYENSRYNIFRQQIKQYFFERYVSALKNDMSIDYSYLEYMISNLS